MAIRYPRALQPGDRIGVTSPSSGVASTLRGRLDVALRTIEERGYQVVVGSCMDGSGIVSAPAAERAQELQSMLTDPAIRAIVPPWGGETAIDIVDRIDWTAVAEAEPTWVVGFSDISTLITPLTLLTGIASVHGNNLMDTPYRVPDGLLGWLDVVGLSAGDSFTQRSAGRFRDTAMDDYVAHPEVDELTLDGVGRWSRLDVRADDGDVVARGRLIGGCIETLCNLAGSPYGDVGSFAAEHAPEGLLVYVEAAEDNAASICRGLHGMRLAGFFEAANAVIVGRTSAPGLVGFAQRDAVLDALGGLGVPIVADVECGHVAPYLPIVNGAVGELVCTAERNELTQTLT